MYFNFVFQMVSAGILFIALFWVLLLAPSYLAVTFEKSRLGPFFSLLSNLIFGYGVCLWPAYCLTIARNFSALPEAAFAWGYYITASLLAAFGAFLSIAAVIRLPKLDLDSATLNRRAELVKIRSNFLMIAIGSLLLFLLWPQSALFLYGWILPKGT